MGSNPIIIGGVGGSGTRVLAESLMASALRTWRDLTVASAAMACALLFKRSSVFEGLDSRQPFTRLWEILEAWPMAIAA